MSRGIARWGGRRVAAAQHGAACRWSSALWLGLAMAVAHVGFAVIYIDHPPHYDEMYHVLAAESWRDSGELRILDGEYGRAALYTKLVGLQGFLCGPSLECARSLSVAASGLMVLAVTASAALLMGPAVALVAGLLLAFNPGIVSASQLVRFYSLHALAMVLFAVAVYALVRPPLYRYRWRPAAVGAGALATFMFALHLQPLTLVGLAGVGVAAVLVNLDLVARWVSAHRPIVVAAAAGGLALAGAGALYALDIGQQIQTLRWTPGWAAGLEAEYLYYHYLINNWYPALWPFAAFLSLLSIARWPRFSLYCLATFVVSFGLLSIAGTKGMRYIVFALPFLMIPMAGGAAAACGLVARYVAGRLESLPLPRLSPGGAYALAVAAVAGGVAAYVVTQPVVRAAGRVASAPGYEQLFGGYNGYADWPAAAAPLRQWALEYPRVLSSSGVKAARYLGDFDFELNYSVMLESDTGGEFGLDPRTGRRTVSSVASVAEILESCGAALAVVEANHANDARQVPAETVALLDAYGTRRDVGAANLIVWTIAATGAASAGACPAR